MLNRRHDASVQHVQNLIAGQWVDGEGAPIDVLDKFTGKPFARLSAASPSQADAAVDAAREAFETVRLSPYDRYKILMAASQKLARDHADILSTFVMETGFTRGDAQTEIARTVQTLELCAEEAKRIAGEGVPVEAAPGHEHRMAFTIRVPVGVVCAITPFNAPLNTVTHKIGPALAAGNAVVLKPAEVTPLTANKLAALLIEAGLPPSLLNVVHGAGEEVGMRLLKNPGIDFYAFTGSSAVGRIISSTIGLRRCSLELGAISGTIVCADADLDWAAVRIVRSSFRKAGQVCTSVQRLFVHRSIVAELAERLRKMTLELAVGDPFEEKTFVGPMISTAEAERVESWIAEAVVEGAKLLAGGKRNGALLSPTLLADVNPASQIVAKEAFGPVVSIIPFDELDEAVKLLNATPYGLSAGIFTENVNWAMKAARSLDVGSVHINETSSARADMMPSAGIKDSGMGREGPRYAVEEMTHERLVTLSLY